MKQRILPNGLAAALFLLAGCATVYNPVTARPERTLYSTREEVRLGRSIDRRIRAEYEVSEDPELAAWVARVGAEVAAVCGRADVAFSFLVLEEDRVNAFAVPGGFIYVTTGMLARIESDDELACVLGHEIAHVAARHTVKHLESQNLFLVPALLANVLTAFQYNWALNLAYTLGQLHYSRRDEFQADEWGMLYARRAGYDPAGAVSLFEKLGDMEARYPWMLMKPLSTHPPMTERVDNARRYAALLAETEKLRARD